MVTKKEVGIKIYMLDKKHKIALWKLAKKEGLPLSQFCREHLMELL